MLLKIKLIKQDNTGHLFYFKSIDPVVKLNVTVDQSDREIEANQQKYFVTTLDDDGVKTDEDAVLEETGKEVCNAFDLQLTPGNLDTGLLELLLSRTVSCGPLNIPQYFLIKITC